ncbi:serine protease inhibitor 42Dd-like [Macrosteles quadrilineatus]|uniref:serine protease inhibitor 42Dd-like n=1 Tax=Macrosteles quadrilineatus TaxID=74068 RepID=UPI0023E267EA|nr:serine protease inhibitor 42Dd-like [Macrosteles quadrilineatus]
MGTGPLLLMGVLALAAAAPQGSAPLGDIRLETPPSNVVGGSTNELATALLQGFVEEERDFAFSPLGYSVVLAIMAEGAGGQTRNQLAAALRLPEDLIAVRDSYKSILQDMTDKWTMNKPQFKNWFYVYKNYTVNENYKKILEENYFTIVKNVDRVHYELSFENEKDKIEEEEDKEEEKEEDKEEKEEETEDKAKSQTANEPKKEEKAAPSLYDGSKDVATALSANKIVDKNRPDLDPQTKMIIFNGFYFRANWKTPFKLVKEEDKRIFYKSLTEKKQVKMMQSKGSFDIGNVPELDATALELPYEGGRYSMLVLLPNQRDGLTKLTSDITGFSLDKVYKYLVERPVEIMLPKYQIQTISHPEKILQKYGVNDLFTNEADLSGMSSDKLKMGALVQLVNIQVDEGSADTNFLTSSLTSGATKRNNIEKFVADHPFLFFIRDYTKNVIVAAGKVLDPRFETEDYFAP